MNSDSCVALPVCTGGMEAKYLDVENQIVGRLHPVKVTTIGMEVTIPDTKTESVVMEATRRT